MRNDFIYKVAQTVMGNRFDPSKRCVRCERIAHDNCYSLQGHKEVEISGLCECCFDMIIASTEEDD